MDGATNQHQETEPTYFKSHRINVSFTLCESLVVRVGVQNYAYASEDLRDKFVWTVGGFIPLIASFFITYLHNHLLTYLLYSLIAFTDKEPKDFMVPSRWGTVRQTIPLS